MLMVPGTLFTVNCDIYAYDDLSLDVINFDLCNHRIWAPRHGPFMVICHRLDTGMALVISMQEGNFLSKLRIDGHIEVIG